jgi:MoxR-like ATPase
MNHATSETISSEEYSRLLLDNGAREEFRGALANYAGDADQLLAQTLAHGYFNNGREAYGKFMVGDPWAKQMYLAGLAMGAVNGMGIVLYGDPGGGKSLLMGKGHRIVEGITDDMVAPIPHRSDLTPAQLVGDQTPMETTHTSESGEITSDQYTAVIRALITPDSKVVLFDEANRTNPHAVQAALKILQDGRIDAYRNGVRKSTDTLDLVAFAENHFGTDYTFITDPALANRRAMGAFVGLSPEPEATNEGEYIPRTGLSDGAVHALANPYEDPDKVNDPVEPIVDTQALSIIRKGIHKVEYPEKELDLTGKLVVDARKTMKELALKSADNRITRQVMRIAQTLAMFNERSVSEVDVVSAVIYALTARLASLGTMEEDAIKKAIDKVIPGETGDNLGIIESAA